MSGRFSRRQFLAGSSLLAAAGCAKLVEPREFPIAPGCEGGETRCAIVDAHCHTFNGSDLPIHGFVSHILPVPKSLTSWATKLFHEAVNGQAPSGAHEIVKLDALARGGEAPVSTTDAETRGKLEELAHLLARQAGLGAMARVKAEELAGTLELIVRYRYEIAEAMFATYPQVDLFTPALVDYAYWSSDITETPLGDQLLVQAKLAELSRSRGHGPRLHPFAPFNPLREVREVMTKEGEYRPFAAAGARYPGEMPAPELDVALAERAGSLLPMRYAIEAAGFAGVKLYPPIGYLPLNNAQLRPYRTNGVGEALDRALRALYSYCEAEDVPVMTHANDSNGYSLGYGVLTAPEQWAPVLREFPRLRLNFGHFGALHGDDGERDTRACELWMRQIAEYMERYPNVYADLGYSLVPVERDKSKRYLDLLEDLFERHPIARQRVMYGSDYWLNRLDANHEAHVNVLDHHFRSARFKSPCTGADQHADFMGRNALRYLGFSAGDDNRHFRRAHRLYAQPPSWLQP